MQSEMTSRLTSEYFMPSVPMAMPSEMVGVPKTWALPPASSMPAIAASASFCRPELQGVMVLWPLATPTMGFLKSAAS